MYGEQLRSLRKEKGLTAEEVALRVNIGRSTYAGYEKERRKPPINVLVKLAKFHNTSIEYILGLSNNKHSIKDQSDLSIYLSNQCLYWKGNPITDKQIKLLNDLCENIISEKVISD
ncbi:helix-turn-helix domain-containing protein [Virgibacillus salexigens]|uniref:helix-turn-helix domain-containing protein n=1 Tax=Virgibacillus salexigens TaxID=61016 RepID=UPI0030817592